jgi:hypothetical protein
MASLISRTEMKSATMAASLEPLRVALMAIASTQPPNWRRPLAAYKNGWVAQIGASEIARDDHGPTVVAWMGHCYVRRAGENKKFGTAIWFSRSMGKNEAGETNYARLITFADGATPTAEPLPEYVAQALAKATR